MFTAPPASARLPYPYRPEFEVLTSLLHGLAAAADWPAAMRSARPWVLLPPGQHGEGIDGGRITPVQVFEHDD